MIEQNSIVRFQGKNSEVKGLDVQTYDHQRHQTVSIYANNVHEFAPDSIVSADIKKAQVGISH